MGSFFLLLDLVKDVTSMMDKILIIEKDNNIS